MEKRIVRFSPPDVGEAEIQEVAQALRSGWITTGPRTKLFERRLAAFIETGSTEIDCASPDAVARYSNRVVCLNSATAAEELNLRILGVGPGDEVIVPAYTYTATAAAAIHCGAKVVFVDTVTPEGAADTHMPEMDYDAVAEAINPRTKAVVAVDLAGIVCDYDRLFEVVESRRDCFVPLEDHSDGLRDLSSRIQHAIGRVAVLADGAHALGASRVFRGQRRFCGNIADFTDFSFHAVKNFTTAEGGAATWRPIPGVADAEIYRFYQLLSLHGQSKDALTKTSLGSWEYDVVGPWYKCNMTDIMAAIGLAQLDRYPELLERRRQILSRYDSMCDQLGLGRLIHQTGEMTSSNHLYLVRVPGITEEQRSEIIDRMAECGVACNVHYKPLPMMTAYRNLGWDVSAFPNAFRYYCGLISLPLHTLLTDEDVEYVIECFSGIVGQYIK